MSNKKGSDIILGSLAALIIIAGLAGVYYWYSQITETQSEIDLKQQEIKSIEAKVKRYPSMLIKLDQLQAEQTQLVNFLPSEEQQKEFVWELETLAKQSGIVIIQCDIAKDIKKLAILPQYQVYQWKLTLQGNFFGITKFLDNLPFSKRAAVVSNLKISAQNAEDNDSKNKQNRLLVDMTLDLLSNPAGEKVAK